jgi:hypothetical protein
MQLFGVPVPEALQPEPDTHGSAVNGEATVAAH